MISLLSERLRIWRLRQTENMTTSPSWLPVLTIRVGRFQCEEFQAHEKRGEHVSKNLFFVLHLNVIMYPKIMLFCFILYTLLILKVFSWVFFGER